MYDPGIGRWLSEDPIGFAGGDVNLYRYVMNRPTVLLDPSGLSGRTHQLPQNVTAYVEWFPDRGVAEMSLRRNGTELIRFRWLESDPNRILVVTEHGGRRLPGVSSSLMNNISLRTNDLLRRMVENAGGTWSQNMTPDIVRAGFPPNPTGSATHPAPTSPPPRSGGTTARAVAGISVYLTLRDACQAAGIIQPDYTAIEAPYYFTAEDGSVYTVQERFLGWSPRRRYVAGPRSGETEPITDAQRDAYQQEAERVWGRYIPGGLFWFQEGPRFIPGTHRRRLPLLDQNGQEIGYIDENGVHRYTPADPQWYHQRA